MNTPTAKPYKAWDLPTRLFHWINFLCVITLSFLGLVKRSPSLYGLSPVADDPAAPGGGYTCRERWRRHFDLGHVQW